MISGHLFGRRDAFHYSYVTVIISNA